MPKYAPTNTMADICQVQKDAVAALGKAKFDAPICKGTMYIDRPRKTGIRKSRVNASREKAKPCAKLSAPRLTKSVADVRSNLTSKSTTAPKTRNNNEQIIKTFELRQMQKALILKELLFLID